jgi:hypothetical protein
LKKEIKKQLENKKMKKSVIDYKWTLKLTLLAFAISFTFSFISEVALKKANLMISIIVVLLFILIGVIFDMIGVAVATADEAPFHSMSSRKIKTAKVAVALKKNADKVSSFCNDVIGDICGIVSGSAGVVIALSVSTMFDLPLLGCVLVTTATIASLTIGGKALEKSFAIEKSNIILYHFAKTLSLFYKEK